MKLDSKAIAQRMLPNILSGVTELDQQWRQVAAVNDFVIDDLFPEDSAQASRSAFPRPKTIALNSRLRALMNAAAQVSQYDPLLEEIIYILPRVGDRRCCRAGHGFLGP